VGNLNRHANIAEVCGTELDPVRRRDIDRKVDA